jgi:hypothetical protein
MTDASSSLKFHHRHDGDAFDLRLNAAPLTKRGVGVLTKEHGFDIL